MLLMINITHFVCACNFIMCLTYIHVPNSVGYTRCMQCTTVCLCICLQVESVMKDRGVMSTANQSVNCHVASRNLPNTDRRTVERY